MWRMSRDMFLNSFVAHSTCWFLYEDMFILGPVCLCASTWNSWSGRKFLWFMVKEQEVCKSCLERNKSIQDHKNSAVYFQLWVSLFLFPLMEIFYSKVTSITLFAQVLCLCRGYACKRIPFCAVCVDGCIVCECVYADMLPGFLHSSPAFWAQTTTFWEVWSREGLKWKYKGGEEGVRGVLSWVPSILRQMSQGNYQSLKQTDCDVTSHSFCIFIFQPVPWAMGIFCCTLLGYV